MKTVKEELQALSELHGGNLSPQIVVDFARDATTALHARFEWDNTKAADEYRLHQARMVLATVRYQDDTGKTRRMFVSLTEDRGTSNSYTHTAIVMSDAEKRRRLANMAVRELESAQERYSELTEIAGPLAEQAAA
jgi:hypothetical protein